ncbi:hypothetical protein LXL04_003211 [Taraxacum kok-saghyz]
MIGQKLFVTDAINQATMRRNVRNDLKNHRTVIFQAARTMTKPFSKNGEDEMPRLNIKWRSHTISHVTAAMALYSASVEDLETIFCFLVFQDMSRSPKNTQKPVMDLLISLQPAQSESLKALSCNMDLADKNKP